MGEILQSLKVVCLQRPRNLSPVVIRRNRLIEAIFNQIEAAKAREAGKRHAIKRTQVVRNKETGARVEVTRETSDREGWWTGSDGKLYFELRYGYKPLEFSKGKSAVEVGNVQNLVSVLEKLKLAAEAGEFDAQMEGAASRLSEQLKVRKQKSHK